MKKILITGATGLLGSYLVKELLENEDNYLFVLARGKGRVSANKRIEDNLQGIFKKKEYSSLARRITVIQGDIEYAQLGLESRDNKMLIGEIDEIYHSAALAQFKVPLQKIRKINVEGTKNILDFAVKCKKEGKLHKVNHISTTYVIGDRKGVFREQELDVGQGFHNTYEQSKYEAELLVRSYIENGLPVSVFRPSILTGDSISGRTNNFKMLYQPLHFFAAELFKVIPASKNALENLIPADFAARAICIIALEKESVNKTYNISHKNAVKLGHFIDMASDFFGFKKPTLVPAEYFDMNRLTFVQQRLISPYAPYFNYDIKFDSKEAGIILEKNRFFYLDIDDIFLLKLFRFCSTAGFIKRKKKTYVAAE